jgi:hypothetical protein
MQQDKSGDLPQGTKILPLNEASKTLKKCKGRKSTPKNKYTLLSKFFKRVGKPKSEPALLPT